MKKILILYHSGVGNTKFVAERIYENLNRDFHLEVYSVEQIAGNLDLNHYDGFVFGFPTVHTHPSTRILRFMESLGILAKPVPDYIFTTCGLYSANTLRIFSKYCVKKNIIPVTHRAYRCAAIDGILLAPFMKLWFYHEKGLDNKIDADCQEFLSKMTTGGCQLNMPRFKLYSILNYPNKWLGQHLTFPIYLHKDRCTGCGKCIRNCPAAALEKDARNYPVFMSKRCEKCYRCIHRCPRKALSLSKKKPPSKVLG
ncbi:EFR1 family ferrodoxin [Paenibacillus sabinae]|uniref:4Fe-4S ferredoxin n=1 Tax=Paenibacillus sabinae T27 TaxID=1268072 RepID=X4ZZE0_9BACL|nr:EFR1 family ferrodoxin [Paenibacillus sabinae]AHV97024.1 4Fe-4S ferredoxin [Paenibacillus sabinae T27]